MDLESSVALRLGFQRRGVCVCTKESLQPWVLKNTLSPPQSSSNLPVYAVSLGRARLEYCSMKEVLITIQVTGLLRKAVPGLRTGSNKQQSLTLWLSPCALFVLDPVREISEQDVAAPLELSSAHSLVANTSPVVAESHFPHCGSQPPAADGRT